MDLDWNAGTWKRTEDSAPPDRRIVVAGDWAPIRNYENAVRHAPGNIYGDLLPVLQGADLRIVNLEVPLSKAGSPIVKEGPNFRGQPDAIGGLTIVPFDVACLANNHIMDFGAEALAETQAALHANGIQTVGAGLSQDDARRPIIMDLPGIRIGILNFCEGEDGTATRDGAGVFGWEIGPVAEATQELRKDADVVIVIAHAGREYVPIPPPYVQTAFRAIAHAGADAVVGHHPHVPQGIEVYGGVPLVYSLGNFIFYQQMASPFQRHGYLLSLELTGKTLSGFTLVPYLLQDEGLRRLTGHEQAILYRQLRRVSEVLDNPGQVRAAWNAFIDDFGEAFWRDELGGIVPLLGGDVKGSDRTAATLRNRFLAPAHRHFMADGLDRMITGRLGTSEAWAAELVHQWRNQGKRDAGPTCADAALPGG